MKKTVFIIGAGMSMSLGMYDTNRLTEHFNNSCENNSSVERLKDICDNFFGIKKYDINDVFNLTDSALLLRNDLVTENEKISFYELEKIKKELVSCFFNEFIKKTRSKDENIFNRYVDFYYSLAKKERDEKIRSNIPFEERDFFISDYSIINFNWDLYSLLPIIEANKKLNDKERVYVPQDRNPKVCMFTDFNCEYACNENSASIWYPVTESTAYALNAAKNGTLKKIILTKCFYPHGAMNLFKCGNCSKHSYYLGELTVESVAQKLNYSDSAVLYRCPFCGNNIYPYDFDVLVQSNFKIRNSYLEEIRLSMIKQLREAERLVFLGYSMPNDDVDYRTMFKSLNNVKEVYVVLKQNGCENKFLSYKDLDKKCEPAIKNFEAVFGTKKRYYNFAGVPDSFDCIKSIL